MIQNKFHDHLDNCKWCEEHPFKLCEKGRQAMEETLEEFRKNPPIKPMPESTRNS